jgi:hypothetical protein
MYIHCPTLSEAAGVHCLVHCLLAEGMIWALIFHVVGTKETILMAWLFLVARGTRVPIFHIKTAVVAHILIGICFDDVGEIWIMLPGRWIGSRGDVRDVGPHVQNRRRHRGSTTPATTCAARMSTATASSAVAFAVMRVVGGVGTGRRFG